MASKKWTLLIPVPPISAEILDRNWNWKSSCDPWLLNQLCGINVLTLDYLQLRRDFQPLSHLARRDFSRFWADEYFKNCQIVTEIILEFLTKIFSYQYRIIKMKMVNPILPNLVWLLRMNNWRTEAIHFLAEASPRLEH